jgi:hypothetical protein
MKRKNLFLFLSRNNRNYKVGINRESYTVIFGGVFIVAHNREGTTGSGAIQPVADRPCGVRDPEHAQTLYVREPGELSGSRRVTGRDGKGRPVAIILTWTLPSSLTSA